MHNKRPFWLKNKVRHLHNACVGNKLVGVLSGITGLFPFLQICIEISENSGNIER